MIPRIFTYRFSTHVLSTTWFINQQGVGVRNMAKILNGKELAGRINDELKQEIATWSVEHNRKPKLCCILVGDDPASVTYIGKKVQAAQYVGIESETIRLDSNIGENDLIDKINQLNNERCVDGILVQLPLPENIDERKICNTVVPEKDVDGFHITNIGKLCLDMDTMVPCTPLGVIEIIKRYNIETFGRNVVVVGRSKNVGLPIAMLLHSDGRHEAHVGMDSTVTICHRYTPPEQLAMFCKNADIIISATGVPGLIKGDMVKPGATVIDVGLTRQTCPDTGKSKIVGDVKYEEVSIVAGAITPVPGGVGPMTVSMLMKNTFLAAKRRQ